MFSTSLLGEAVKQNNKKITMFLLENGTNVQNVGNFLFPGQNRHSALLYVKDESMIELLIKFGGNINFIVGQNNYHLIHKAARLNNYVLLKYQLENGINPNTVDNEGYTPLHIAVNFKKINCIKLLLEYGADKTLIANNGNSAMNTTDPEILKLLQ